MNKTTLFFLAIGAAVAYGFTKLLGKPAAADNSLSGRLTGTLGGLANGALASVPDKYGFKAPIAAVLGGNKSVVAAKPSSSSAGTGAATTAAIDLSKSLAKFLSQFEAKDPLDGAHSTNEDYLAALAEAGANFTGPNGSEYVSVDGASVPANFSTESDYKNAQASATLDQFYADAAQAEPLRGAPGRNFSLEDQTPLNITEPAVGDAYPPWSDPGGADFSFFTDPLGQAA